MSRSILLAAVLAACEPLPPASMAQIEFPDGFRLDAHAAVALTVEAPDAPEGRLVVRTPEGGVLYEGSAALAARRGLGLKVPPTTRTLDVTWTHAGVVEVIEAPVADGRATVRLPEVR